MDSITKLYLRILERSRGQTMSEYALTVAVLSIVVFGSYKTIGLTLQSLISSFEALL